MTAMTVQDVSARPAYGTPAYSRYIELRRCKLKQQYTCEWVAANAIIALSWKDPSFSVLVPYYCHYCDHYHIGHPYVPHNGEIPRGTQRALKMLASEAKKDDND